LLERETSWRHDKRFTARLRYAKLRQQACMEDVDYRTPRNLDRSLFQKLAGGQWIEDHDNLVVTGPTGVGKSWLAQALGHTACRGNRSVLYQRVPRLFAELALARGDGRHPRLLRSLGRVDLLILDDWGLVLDVVHAGGESAFVKADDAPRHVVGRQAGVAEDDADHRNVYVREDVGRRAESGRQTEDHDQQRHDDEGIRTPER
jgi:hypothetical protein